MSPVSQCKSAGMSRNLINNYKCRQQDVDARRTSSLLPTPIPYRQQWQRPTPRRTGRYLDMKLSLALALSPLYFPTVGNLSET